MRRWHRTLSLLGLLLLGLGGLLPVLSWNGVPAAQAGVDPGMPANAGRPACYVLDDPQTRARMSAMGEEALLEACGRALPASPPPVSAPPPPSPVRGGISSADVRITVVDPIATSTTQSETSIDINRTNGTLCAHWNDSYHYLVQNLSYIGFARSTDGGLTWQDGPNNYLPQGAGGRARGDPSVAWRALDNRWYATAIHLGSSQGLGFWQSADDCATFQWVGMSHAGSADDKELLVIDNHPSSPHYGRMYVAWMDFAAGMSVTFSDNGTSWSTPFVVSYDNVQGAWPAVAPNGDVYVAWVRWASSDLMDMEVSRSTNGGVTFARVTNPAAGVTVPRDAGATSQCGRAALNGRIRYLPSPQIDVGPDGGLHVVYPYDPDGYNVGDVISSYYRRSTDNGQTWGPERRLNDDTTLTDQFFPNVTVNDNNVVAASWYDRRLDPAGNLLFDRYWAYSTDGGQTWQPNERVSDVSSPVYIDPNMSICYHGDYDQIASDAAGVHIIWSDDRVYFNGHYDPDIWFERVSLQCDPLEGAGFAWTPNMPQVNQLVTFTASTWGVGDSGWLTETVDSAGNVGLWNSLALDSAGRPHIGYYDDTNSRLVYAYYDGSAWQKQTVGSDTAAYPSLDLDSSDRPHLSYYVLTSGDLEYAYYDGSAWQIQPLSTSGDVGMYNSLALDSEDHPHISYIYGVEFSLQYARYNGFTWKLETVDPAGLVGWGTSLALDGADRPRISYYSDDITGGYLRYASFDGSFWYTETVDSVGDWGAPAGLGNSLALNLQGLPRIAYYDATAGDLRYASYDGSSWQTQTVDTAGDVGWNTSLAIDEFDRPHISYVDATLRTLKYAWYDGATWHIEVVAGVNDGDVASLVLDRTGSPHISYRAFAARDLCYAWIEPLGATPPISYMWDLGDGATASEMIVTHTYDLPGIYTATLTATNCVSATATVVHSLTVIPCRPVRDADFGWVPQEPVVDQPVVFTATAWGPASGDWFTETVDRVGNTGTDPSLAMDREDRPHISYFDYTENALKYAHWEGLGWSIQVVDSEGRVGENSSLDLDSAGRPAIAYYDDTNRGLKYAHYDGETWQIESVDYLTGGYVDISLALDSADRPHISYASTYIDLRYARYDGIAWVTETVDYGDGSPACSLALDASDHAHISYHGFGDLKYAYDDGGTWQIQTVDGTTSAVGLHNDIALDLSGRPHISYQDYTHSALKYAFYDGTTWQLEMVDSAGNVGMDTSIALDGDGDPHISYRSYGTPYTGIKYARRTNGVWQMRAVDGGEGRDSLALDQAGRPYIAYRQSWWQDLGYARPEWLAPALPVTYAWSLGDGAYAAGEAATHSYSLPGVYTVVLTATNCGGATATAVHTITVLPPPCEPVHDAAFTWTPLTPTVGQAVTFTGTATGTLPITYSWKLDIGSWKTGQVVTYTYETPGVYTVVLTATNCATATAAVTREITVLPPPCEPVHDAAFTWTPLTPTVGQQVAFTGTATGTRPITFTWDFGDGARVASSPLPLREGGQGGRAWWRPGGAGLRGAVVTYSYDTPGLYTVTLTATNCATATATAVHTLTVLLPCDPVEIVTVTQAVSGCVVTLGAELTGTAPFTYLWTAGLLSSTLPMPTFDFGASGTYTVTLAVGNCGGQDVWVGPVTVVCPGSAWKVYLPLVSR